MVYRAKTAFILSDDAAFAELCVRVCNENKVGAVVHKEWSKSGKIPQGIILCDCNMAGSINSEYARKTVIVLQEGFSYSHFMPDYGRFVFDRTNADEIAFALLTWNGEICMPRRECTVSAMIKLTGIKRFDKCDCEFDFDMGRYFYKGEQVYFTPAQKVALCRILLLGEKSIYTRTNLSRFRKQLGADFLKDWQAGEV